MQNISFVKKRLHKVVKVMDDLYVDLWEKTIYFLCYWQKKIIKKNKRSPNNINRILVINTHKLGDLISMIPLLRAMKNSHPNSCIVLLIANQVVNDFLLDCPFVNTFIRIDKILVARKKKKISILEQLKLFLLLRNKNFDLIVSSSLDNGKWYQSLSCLANAKLTVGFKFKKEEEKIFDETIIYDRTKTEMENNRNILKTIFGMTNNQYYDYCCDYWFGKEINNFNNLINQIIKKRRELLIGIHAFGSTINQNWSTSKFSELIGYLIKFHKATVILLGDKKDIAEGDIIANNCGYSIVNLIGRTNIKELAYVVKNLDLLICVDSGIMHLRALMNKDLVAIFGPGDVLRWRPNISEEKYEIVKIEIECRPCFDKICPEHYCMESISINDVIFAVERQLKKINRRLPEICPK